jgi:hypothetical protein
MRARDIEKKCESNAFLAENFILFYRFNIFVFKFRNKNVHNLVAYRARTKKKVRSAHFSPLNYIVVCVL